MKSMTPELGTATGTVVSETDTASVAEIGTAASEVGIGTVEPDTEVVARNFEASTP
jgi:hypothetical protein